MDERGRIVLPVTVRESLDMKLGDFLTVEHKGNGIRITNKRKKALSVVQISRNCFEMR